MGCLRSWHPVGFSAYRWDYRVLHPPATLFDVAFLEPYLGDHGFGRTGDPSVTRRPPNMRLKLSAPASKGSDLFVNARMVRRSLGALR